MDAPPATGRRPQVAVTDDQDDVAVDVDRWAAFAADVLEGLGLDGSVELAVAFVDEATIAELHLEHLDLPGPTDVLSFPVDGEGAAASLVAAVDRADGSLVVDGLPSGPEPWLLGDIVICPAVAVAQAPDHAGTPDDELALLLVHGVLHLLGLDHADPDDAQVMQAWEQGLLARHHGRLAGHPWGA
ncbi:MAG: rRNA maturation RNase YbeY [Acidimicrobiales bacterium]